ncbi:hypothetical protein HKX48_007441 [Thoreauomyces humboldtii]|nr:hypothetical protein HKX48_007441 [Thoreauomyces humboldtii]
MTLLDFFNKHRELRRIEKYTKRRKDADTSPVPSVTALKIPKPSYKWDTERHAQEYYSVPIAKTPVVQRTGDAGYSTMGRPRSMAAGPATAPPQGQGILIVLADDDDDEADGRDHPSYSSIRNPRLAHAQDQERRATTRGTVSFDSPREYDRALQARLARTGTTNKRSSIFWKGYKGQSIPKDDTTVRSSEDYNKLDGYARRRG